MSYESERPKPVSFSEVHDAALAAVAALEREAESWAITANWKRGIVLNRPAFLARSAKLKAAAERLKTALGS